MDMINERNEQCHRGQPSLAKVGEGKLGYTILTPTTPAVAHIVLHNVGPWYYKVLFGLRTNGEPYNTKVTNFQMKNMNIFHY